MTVAAVGRRPAALRPARAAALLKEKEGAVRPPEIHHRRRDQERGSARSMADESRIRRVGSVIRWRRRNGWLLLHGLSATAIPAQFRRSFSTRRPVPGGCG